MIEAFNYCPKCGKKLINKVVENKNVPYCKDCDELYFPSYNVAVSLIVNYLDKVLLIKQYSKDDYILVAGYVEKGESVEEAAIRELKEETSLDGTFIKVLKTKYFSKTNTLMINCLVKVDSLSYHLNEEVDEACWFNKEEAIKNIKANSLASEFLNNYYIRG